MRKTILVLSLSLLLAGCSTVAQPGGVPIVTTPPAETADLTTDAPAYDPPAWDEQVYMTAYAVEGRDEPVFRPEYRLPRIANAAGVPAYEAINAYYADILSDLAVAAADLSAWAVDDYRTTQATGEPFYPFTDTESYVISVQTSGFVSVLRTHAGATGSPQTVSYPIGDTFDLGSGQRLLFADLFTCSQKDAAGRVLSTIITQNAAGSYMGAVFDADALTAAFEPEQFYLTESALVLYFPAWDIPGAIGSPTFAIPYTELADVWALPLS